MDRRQFLQRTGVAAVGVASINVFNGRVAGAVQTPPLVSTYDHYDYQQPPGPDQGYYLTLKDGYTETGYDTIGNIPSLDTNCQEVVVYIHGLGVDDQQVGDSASTAHTELVDAGYSGGFVGYSWDSATWSVYRSNEVADRNGTKLAQFLVDLKLACPEQSVHLVSHGLGARVVMSSLAVLDTHSNWTTEMEIGSVQLLGAAVDNTEPAVAPIDSIIAAQTGTTKNYHSEQDSALSDMVYYIDSVDTALGETGVPSSQSAPENYTDIDVTAGVGSDHSAYLSTASDAITSEFGDDPVEYSWPLYDRGDEGEAVYTIQYLLGHHGHELNAHDGIYGSETQTTIETFQNDRGLLVDGIVGPNTWRELIVPVLPDQAPWWATFATQHNLKHGHGFDIAVDGDYGPETRSAIEDFQRDAGLTVDGLVGTNTWQALVDRL